MYGFGEKYRSRCELNIRAAEILEITSLCLNCSHVFMYFSFKPYIDGAHFTKCFQYCCEEVSCVLNIGYG